ncbi:probable mediator of RNA polymerase II transcription subunit 26c isoform X2 [Juglans microcarpa x Juglans regia]|uniref:probable mediator of RNA polymerase II transcription subunit 26c isoform X1 n=1 Tax=Juglans microcarpa x Juglans regia TaxID=2249226 RepID=UPI001B7E5A2E|nr:probable mediator of RNA polymerase II transcription subunit 26c isoform X1 [Juglans microcarpa x Juglans regia]XP_041009246.1 probable mediator of RNA polymerase II transcription subunit 26c isoform X2 [Juglans microcarpa x Juglans regia]
MATMDLDDFREVLESCGVDVWTFIDTAITVASSDYGDELKHRRDGIVERLYAATSPGQPRCRNCDDVDNLRPNNRREAKAPAGKDSSGHEGKGGSPMTPQSVEGEDVGDLDPYGGLFDDEQAKILEIKEHLEDPDQSDDSLVELLQSLADMDITFQALKETDIGRHVNRLRKHSSSDVRRLVKLLVRKWKDIVDEWVKLNQPGEQTSSALMEDGESPLRKIPQNSHHQVPDFGYSPNPHNGSSGSDKNNSESEPKPKVIPRKEAPLRPAQSTTLSASAHQNRQREQKDFDSERLASARKRLQENYKEAQNAKKQRTIQVMDIHEIPKPKNTFFAKNRGGGGGSHGRRW